MGELTLPNPQNVDSGPRFSLILPVRGPGRAGGPPGEMYQAREGLQFVA